VGPEIVLKHQQVRKIFTLKTQSLCDPYDSITGTAGKMER